jgi:hypothetical protein
MLTTLHRNHEVFTTSFVAVTALSILLAGSGGVRAQSGSRVQLGQSTVGLEGYCPVCVHGVVPIGSPDQLGLAVNAPEGNVYVIEDAHKLYPNVYEHRFEGLPLEVRGKVLKRDGKITWIQPAQLKVLN